MGQLYDNTIRFQDALIYYTTAGERAKQPLVFLHGAPWGTKSFDVVRELAKYFYVVAPEQPGFGRSDPLPDYTNLSEQYADVIHQILVEERLDAAKPIIMAQSFGGKAAHGYLKKYPENISYLVFTDAVMPTMPVPYTWRILWIQVILPLVGGTLLPWVPVLMTRWLVKNIFRRYTIVWNAVVTYPKRMRSLACHRASNVFKSWRSRCPEMQVDYSVCPILMLWGERDGEEHTIVEGGGITHIRIARELYEKIRKVNPEARFVTLRGGHTILYDNPSYVAGEIARFIKNE